MMTEDRFDRCCWWYIALLVICVLAIVGVMLVVSLLEADHDAPEPPTETVDTETQAEAAAPVALFDEVAKVGKEDPTYQEADRGSDEFQLYLHFVDAPGAYLEWRFTARYSYDNCLIPSGREVYYTGTTDHEASDSYMVDAYAAYSAYKLSTFVRLRGHPGSKLCDEEYALHFVLVCMEAGRDWETALAICELESTYGAASNLFGICDNRFDGRTIEGYCAYLHYYQVVNPGAMGYRGGHSNELIDVFTVYNDHQEWRDNVTELVAGIRGEVY